MPEAPAPIRAEEAREDEATRAMIADLERELGVTGTANVFRKALALAKEAAAEVRARQEAYSANDLVYRLRAWGESDPDPSFFTGDLLSGVLMDCGAGSEAIIVAEARAARAEAEVARLTAENERMREACLKAAASVSYGPPSSWPGDYPRGWRHPPCWDEDRKPTPHEAAWHDNGARDAWFAIRALPASQGGGDAP